VPSTCHGCARAGCARPDGAGAGVCRARFCRDNRRRAAISSDKLDAQRGGADTVNNNMQLEGGVHGNVANHVVTGANSIDSGSFANMSGIPTVIQNSGANVLIQNATIINLQLK
jgi:hypothetical protein